MRVIRSGGSVAEQQLNTVRPGDTVEWPKVDPGGPIIIKPTAINFQPAKPKILPLLPESAINFPGEDKERDFVVKPTTEGLQKIIHDKAELRARERALQPLPPAKIVIPGEGPWPYVVKLSPRAPRPDLKFDPETFTYFSANVKSLQPRYRVQTESIIYIPLKTTPDGNIIIRPW